MHARTTTELVLALLAMAGYVSAAVVTLPDTSQTTTFTATVSEQANVSVPASVTFTVTNVSSNEILSAAQSVSATTIVLTDGKKLRVELAPNAADFTPPTGGTVTWVSSDIAWTSATWTNGIGNWSYMSGTPGTYNKLADMSSANATELSTVDLQFHLNLKTTIDRAGNHTLIATWRFSSF